MIQIIDGISPDGFHIYRNDFTQTRSGSSASTGSFISTGTKVVFDGTSGQTVVLNEPGVASSSFKDVDMDNAAGVTFTKSAFFTGRLTLLPHAIMNQGGGIFISFTTHLPAISSEATLTLDQFIAANPQAGTLPVTITTGQLRVSTFPTVFSLGTNRPNPFNPSTTIAFNVPQVAHITLTIYNVLGQEVIRLIDEQRSPGRYEVAWNGRNAQGAGVSTGIYMYRLTSSTGFAEAKRMTLLK